MARNQMEAGDVLVQGQYLQSPDGRTRFSFQDDGNCCLEVNKKVAWATMTQNFAGSGSRRAEFVLQEDGNICLYAETGRRDLIWQSHSNRPATSIRLVCQDDNNLVLYLDNYYVWASETAHLPKWSEQRLHELKSALGLDPNMENAAAQHAAEEELQRRTRKMDDLKRELYSADEEYRARKDEAFFLEHPFDWYKEHGLSAIPPVFTTRTKWDAIRDRDAAANVYKERADAYREAAEPYTEYRHHFEELKREVQKFPADN